MGCGSSREAPPPPSRIRQLSRSQYMQLQFPGARSDPLAPPSPFSHPSRIPEHGIDRQTIEHALEFAAQYLDSRGEDLAVIAFGCVVDTLLLQTRRTAHDIDFLGINLNNRQQRLLNEAAQYAGSQSSKSLGEYWLNNATATNLGPDIQRSITQAALVQNEVIFRRAGLTVLVAPWSFVFCAKVSRILTRDREAYDIMDAAAYLHFYKRSHRNEPVPLEAVMGWTRIFDTAISKTVLAEINTEYKQRYGSNGIRIKKK